MNERPDAGRGEAGATHAPPPLLSKQIDSAVLCYHWLNLSLTNCSSKGRMGGFQLWSRRSKNMEHLLIELSLHIA